MFELWLQLAAGVVSPEGPETWEGPDQDGDEPGENELAVICAIDHLLAVISALAEGGPGTAASAADLAAYVRDYDPGDPEDPDDGGPGEADERDDFFFSEDDDEFDDLTMEGMFLPVVSLWQVLGAVDEDERLTALGWWGLPEAMLRVWAPSDVTPE